MQIQFNLTLDDLIAFNQYCVYHSPLIEGFYAILRFGIPACSVLMVLITPSKEMTWSSWIGYITFLLAFTIVTVLVLTYSLRRQLDKQADNVATKILATEKYREALSEHTISIGDFGLLETTELKEWYWTWTGVDRIEQDDSYIFIFLKSARAHIIPKRAFTNTEQVMEFYNNAKMLHARG